MKPETLFREGRRLVTWLAILGLALLFIMLRWNSCQAPLIRDEGEYGYAAQLLIHGGLPYEHAFVQKPPMVIYSYALASLLLPDVFWAPRLLAYVLVALATGLLGYIARLEFGKGFALPVMCLATPMILLPGLDQFPANTEMFLLLPLLATFAIYVQARQRQHTFKHWLAAGFCGATTLCYKYTALPVIAFVFIIWALEFWRQTHDARLFRRNLMAVVLGGGLAAVLELGIFLLHDGGAGFWECTVSYNRHYLHSSNFNPANLWLWIKIFWRSWWVLFFVPWAMVLRPHSRIWFWLGAWMCAALSTSASIYGQYYIVLMPFWALLAVVGLRNLMAGLARWPALSGRWIGDLLIILVLLLLLRPDVPWLTCSREQFAGKKMDGYPFIGAQTVARRVAALSGPGDFVFVAGSEPEILVYAHRFSPSRLITSYTMMIPTTVAGSYQREAMNDLLARPPKLIIFPLAGNSWLRQTNTPPDFLNFLQQFLAEKYVLVGGYLPDKQKGCWSEPLATNAVADANLLLFQRKPPR
jgi:hypothetical protein